MISRDEDSSIAFYEEQQFRQKWLWSLLLCATLVAIGWFGYGMCRQLLGGNPWGNRPLSDTALVIVGTISILFPAGISYLFCALKLITQVRNDGLFIQFFPLSRQRIAFENIKTCTVRTYSPIKEYGGWGIRYGRKGKAYNVSGNIGVQLEFFSGKPLLIGSLKAEVLDEAIRAYMPSERKMREVTENSHLAH